MLDARFTSGEYHGSKRHDPDFDLIIERSVKQGVCKLVVTAGTVDESRNAVQACRQWRQEFPGMDFYCTVGVHPTRCQQVFEQSEKDSDVILQELLEIAKDGMKDNTVVAIGELGLDYDRLQFTPMECQRKFFIAQLEKLAKPTGLPLFLHNRNTGTDTLDILREHSDCWSVGVVHSYTDGLELANRFINELNLYIGLNGCSLRTDDCLRCVKELGLDRILLETDCPYCDIRKSHPSYKYVQTEFPSKIEKKFERGILVKGRQEPCHMQQVAEVVAGVKGLPLVDVARQCYENTLACFSIGVTAASNTAKQPR